MTTNASYNPFSAQFIRNTMKENHFWLSKDRGQNYLYDKKIAQRIVSNVPKDAVVFEVGSGLGALTSLLCEDFKTYSVEIDSGIFALLSQLLFSPRLHLVHADFLEFDFKSIEEELLFFVSNLPYSISGEAIKRFIDCPKFSSGVVMLQAEFVERMTARPATKEYGVMGVLAQTYLKIEPLFSVSKNSFFPAPTVDSFVVRLTKTDCRIPQDAYNEFLRKAFSAKRKTIRNNFNRMNMDLSILEKLNIPLTVRPAEIEAEKWVQLFEEYQSQ